MHIIQFLYDAYKFIDKHGIASDLIVDGTNEFDDLDLFDDLCDSPAGMIAEMQNVAAETIWKLEKYYSDNGCKKELARLHKLRIKHFNS